MIHLPYKPSYVVRIRGKKHILFTYQIWGQGGIRITGVPVPRQANGTLRKLY